MSSPASGVMSFIGLSYPFLRRCSLDVAQVLVELVEPLLPDPPVLLDPAHGRVEHLTLQVAGPEEVRRYLRGMGLAGGGWGQGQGLADEPHLYLDGGVASLVSLVERPRLREGGRPRLPGGEPASPLVSLDQGPGYRGDRGRERDRGELRVKQGLGGHLGPQVSRGCGELAALAPRATVVGDFRALVGRIGH